MTKSQTIKNVLLFISSGVLASAQVDIPDRPIGSISSSDSLVLTNSLVDLDWRISYPVERGEDEVETDSVVTVKFITFSIGTNSTMRFGTTVNGRNYTQHYNGVSETNPNYQLDAGTVVIDKLLLSKFEDIEFWARHFNPANSVRQVDNGWVGHRRPYNTNNDLMIVELNNGDDVPDLDGEVGQRSLVEILEPYSKDGKISIGENESIILFEVFTRETNHSSYDLNDLILLVSYDQVPLSSYDL